MLDKPSHGAGPRTQEQLHRQARHLRIWALIVLIPVAVIGAALSFQSLYRAAVPVFGTTLALGFPLLVDFLILGASLQYVAGAKIGRPRAGWRWTAHAGVAGTLLLNAMAARTLHEVPWHVTAPAVWSVLVELTAREVLGQWRATHAPLGDRIPLRLWLTAPLESARTWLRIARRVEGEQARARLDVGVHAAAVEALKLALPQRRARRVRRILQRQLRAGSLPPSAILGPLGWMEADDALTDVTPETVLRAALRDTLRGSDAALSPTRTTNRVPSARAEDAIDAGVGESTDTREIRMLARATAAPADQAETVPGERGSEATAAVTAGTEPPSPELSPDSVAQAMTVPVEPRVIDLEHPAVHPTDAPAPPPAIATAASTGVRFADAVDIVRVHESVTAVQLATQLRGLGWQLSDRTAGRILADVKDHLTQMDPWALPTP